jgi:ribonuclease HIII
VVGAAAGNPLKAILERLCAPGPREPEGVMHEWHRWIGSDECGKGDYFGALVVAAFAADRELEPELRALGVADSKRLKDPQIKAIALKLYERYNPRIACVVLKPLKYNQIIADRQQRRENLNDLLAWQHGAAILELTEKQPSAEGVLVDQFSRGQKVKALLKDKGFQPPVVERHGAEADIAVAAASVIARYQFLQQHASLKRHYGMDFPLGANHNVKAVAQAFIDKYGLKRLGEVAKLHFVTSRSVQQREIF